MTEYEIASMLSWLSDNTLIDMRNDYRQCLPHASEHEAELIVRYIDCIDNMTDARDAVDNPIIRR